MLLYFLQDQKTDASAHYFVDKYSNSQKLLHGTNLFSRVCLEKKTCSNSTPQGSTGTTYAPVPEEQDHAAEQGVIKTVQTCFLF